MSVSLIDPSLKIYSRGKGWGFNTYSNSIGPINSSLKINLGGKGWS